MRIRASRTPTPRRPATGVVAIGATSDGIKALRLLFRESPRDTGRAFVFLPRKDPNAKSIRLSQLAKLDHMPVIPLHGDVALESNHLYVAPEDAGLDIRKGILRLIAARTRRRSAAPIDRFFGAVAREYGPESIGILLSGPVNDGILGLKALKKSGGVTFAQQPESLRFGEMPQVAVAAGAVDYVLSPSEIGKALSTVQTRLHVDIAPGATPSPISATQREWARILKLMESGLSEKVRSTGTHLIKSCVGRRMEERKIVRLSTYLSVLEKDPKEVHVICNRLLSEAGFFRDQSLFDLLQSETLPRILKGSRPGKTIRIWVPECGSGEEVYSVAVCALEFLKKRRMEVSVQVFGTDADASAISTARQGIYREPSFSRVSTERKQRFFTLLNGNNGAERYQVEPSIRGICAFSQLDLITDPHFARIDLIVCRDILTRFHPDSQAQILRSFHRALDENGLLVLGRSETISGFPRLFALVDQNNKVYRKAVAAPLLISESYRPRPAALRSPRQAANSDEVSKELARTREYLQAVIQEKETTVQELRTSNEEIMSRVEELSTANSELQLAREQLQAQNEELRALDDELRSRNRDLQELSGDLNNLLSSSSIPILVIGQNGRIQRFTPAAELLLRLTPDDVGRPINDLSMGMKTTHLDDSIREVIERGSVLERDIRAADGRWYAVRMRPYRDDGAIVGAVIAFVDVHELRNAQETLRARGSLISTILDTATDLLVLILDDNLRIDQFNRVCQKLTGYTVEEVRGRRMWDFLLPPNEIDRVKAACEHPPDTKTEAHLLAKDGSVRLISWSHSAMKDTRGRNAQVICVGVDMTEREEARREILEKQATVEALLESASQTILAVNQEGEIVLANRTAGTMFGYDRPEIIGMSVDRLVPERFRNQHSVHRTGFFARMSRRAMASGLEPVALRKDGSEFPTDISLSFIQTRDGPLAVAFISDITERKKSEAALLTYQQELRALTAKLIAASESENRTLARELHDSFSQELASLGMEISDLRKLSTSNPALAKRLEILGQRTTTLADNIHRMSRLLHPAVLDDLGLEAAIKEECAALSKQCGIPVTVESERMPARLPEELALCLYRVAQESLRNIGKHAQASEVRVRLAVQDGEITLSIRDVGDGFDLNEVKGKGGLGLVSMEERVRLIGGAFEIQSEPGKGTRVEIRAPLAKGAMR